MAKVSPVIPFSNTLGDFSVYKMKDVEKLVIRAKHGPAKEELAIFRQYEKFWLSIFRIIKLLPECLAPDEITWLFLK